MSRPIALTQEEVTRFWSYVDGAVLNADSCWPWLGGKNRGYGVFTASGRSLRAHRVAFMLGTGVAIVRPDVVVRHVVCHNPPCCNPAHLALGSVLDNASDARIAERCARGAKNGATKLTPEQVVQIRRRARAGESASKVLAPEFKVSSMTVRLIRDGRTWAWLKDPDDGCAAPVVREVEVEQEPHASDEIIWR